MKTLSIKQPWASLIALGIKDVENRTWKTKFRGRILIHASAATVFDAYLPNGGIVGNWIDKHGYGWHYNNIPHSAIIGEVDIVDCMINNQSIWAEKSEPELWDDLGYPIYDRPIYNWILANAVLYNAPISNIKGKLSFWEFNKQTITLK